MKIIAIGRNYVEHAKELNNPLPEEPVFFLKPDSALLPNRKPFFYPNFSSEIHYEVELVVKISRVGRHIEKRFAHRYYDEIGVGIDFTARDIQRQCKAKGLPWEKAKAFDASAPLGKFMTKNHFRDVQDIDFFLEKNDEIVQQGNSKNMIFSIDSIIEYLSQFFTLKMGDLIYTGTPQGVGQVAVGDNLRAGIGNKILLETPIR